MPLFTNLTRRHWKLCAFLAGIATFPRFWNKKISARAIGGVAHKRQSQPDKSSEPQSFLPCDIKSGVAALPAPGNARQLSFSSISALDSSRENSNPGFRFLSRFGSNKAICSVTHQDTRWAEFSGRASPRSKWHRAYRRYA